MSNLTHRYVFIGIKLALFWLALLLAGCSGRTASPEASTPAVTAAAATAVPTLPAATEAPTLLPSETAEATPEPVLAEGVLYQDDFTTLAGGWPELEFDNGYVGYHEPEFYHVEVHSPQDDELVPVPDLSFEDFTAEVDVFSEPSLTAPEGNYHYGLAFRRTGNQYYAFLISPVTKDWSVVKHSATGAEVLQEGQSETIQGPGVTDHLRVDARGGEFFFTLNDETFGPVEDGDYAGGEIAFIVQTDDSPQAHIHYDELVIRDVELEQAQQAVLYEDDFTTLAGGWPELEFDNGYVGYHEPEFYHVEVHSPQDDELVPVPNSTFEDFTAEVDVFDEPSLTAPEGDYHYGLAFHRTGNQYYAFTLSPVTQTWYVLKSSQTGIEVLKEGSSDSIQGPGVTDRLRVDARGDQFFFHLNGQQVYLMNDGDYTGGEIAFIVQTADNPQAHIHYDKLVIREVEAPQLRCAVATKALNLRTGPGTHFRLVTALTKDTPFEPLGRTEDELWVQVRVSDSGQEGWVSNASNFIACDVPVSDLPVTEP